MKNSNYYGNLAELQVITRFYELGYTVSTPFGQDNRYDMILDKNGKLYRLQCKHANPHKNENGIIDFIMIRTTRQESHSNKRIKYSEEDCDYFVTYYEGKNYLIPVNQCSNSKTLRILKPKNGQTKDINFLKDFEDEEVLKKI